MKVLAVDPGVTTGFSYFDGETGEFRSWAEEAPMDAINYVNNLCHRCALDVLVVERFTISARTVQASRGGSNTAIEMIGALRWIANVWSVIGEDAEIRHVVRFVEQSPSDAKGFVTDQKLKQIGLYTPGKDHARDATRHLVTWMVRNGIMDPAKLLSSNAEEVGSGSS